MGKGRPLHSSPSLLTSYSNRTEGPSTDGIRCGRWLLRSTCFRRRRAYFTELLSLHLFCYDLVSIFMNLAGDCFSVISFYYLGVICFIFLLLGQPLSLKFEPSTPTSKRKRHDTSSPTPSANSFTDENSVQVVLLLLLSNVDFIRHDMILHISSHCSN
ncbi:hypothetical protein RHSIM_Rhsim12G0104100 [Rhododendron simsii]|uniref:Uncharacterized protein n=1 Tax=Rhododendron simsii TaxID=118357 RepID=A0A834L8W5_RHOSS|nr:hypothetical protein RHSIM_Rhsim12G0104100 [Rhododendron simsii]